MPAVNLSVVSCEGTVSMAVDPADSAAMEDAREDVAAWPQEDRYFST